MSMSWKAAFDSQEQGLEHTLAQRHLQNQEGLQIVGAQERMRENRANDAVRNEQTAAIKEFRDAQAAAIKSKNEQELSTLKRIEEIALDPDGEQKYGSQAYQAAKLMRLGIKPTVNLTDKTDEGGVKPVLWVGRDGKMRQIGEAPKGSHFVNEPAPPGGGGSGTPYFTPIQTGGGVVSFDNRTGKVSGRVGDLKPSATMLDKIASGESTLEQLNNLKGMFNPDWVGPAAGRYNNVKLAIVGEQGEEGLASMSAAVATLKNAVIKDITGAQMSEPEALRIMQQIPDMNNPPDVFMARLKMTEKNRAFLLDRQKKLGYGQDQGIPNPGSGDTTATPAAPGLSYQDYVNSRTKKP